MREVVLIKNDQPAPRCKLRLRKILQLAVGRDGQARGAITKSGQQTTMFRPIQNLVPFEIVEAHTDTESPKVKRAQQIKTRTIDKQGKRQERPRSKDRT